MKNNVISLSKKIMEKRNEKDEVTIDFIEFDLIRLKINQIVKSMRRKEWVPKGAYDRSVFYIGRGVTRISFYEVYCSEFQLDKLIKILKATMGSGYKYFKGKESHNGMDLHIYFRGKPR